MRLMGRPNLNLPDHVCECCRIVIVGDHIMIHCNQLDQEVLEKLRAKLPPVCEIKAWCTLSNIQTAAT